MAEPGLLDRLTVGDHICWWYDDDRVHVQAVAGFVRRGLQDGHKIVYCGDDPTSILDQIAELGVAVAPALASGQLLTSTPEVAYLDEEGRFDAAAVLRKWARYSVAARDEGYRGLRVMGEQAWATRGAPGSENMLWYEEQANRLFLEHDLIGVCAYDRRVFDPLDLRRIVWAHPGCATAGSPFNEALSLRFRRTRDPVGVRLEGEIDLSNRRALRTVIEHLFADAGTNEVTVDVRDLRFADGETAAILVRAGTSPRRVRLVGCSPELVHLLNFAGAQSAAGLTIE